ncbi:hypothetical protein [Litchfieldia alkalitelluris]|uniref:hypothetical protein n=1 Tax=Litchfieldia alkalitelluris TaxID=304268 RepID=UPI000996806F|nr:hypothetical protein [Litchfieldia alkalitelluris]
MTSLINKLMNKYDLGIKPGPALRYNLYGVRDNNLEQEELPEVDLYSDVLYWEAVHEGDINPDDDTVNSYDDYFHLDYLENDYHRTRYVDHGHLLNSLKTICSTKDLDVSTISNILIKVSGYGDLKVNEYVNQKMKEFLDEYSDEVAEDLGLIKKSSSASIWLENQAGKRYIQFRYSTNPYCIYKDKTIIFHNGIDVDKVEIAFDYFALTGISIPLKYRSKILKGEEFKTGTELLNLNNPSDHLLQISYRNQTTQFRNSPELTLWYGELGGDYFDDVEYIKVFGPVPRTERHVEDDEF